MSVTEEIQNRLAGMDLRINLSGKWLSRAQDLSKFALRVIGSPEVALYRQRAAELGAVEGTLYAGLPPDVEVNTAAYWQSVLSNLQPDPTRNTSDLV
jgi:hypothetical protein